MYKDWRKALTIMCTSSLPLLLSSVLRLWVPDAVLSIPSMSLNVMISGTMLSRLRCHETRPGCAFKWSGT